MADAATAEAERQAWLRLLRAPGLGAQSLRELFDRFASAQTAVAEASRHGTSLGLPQAARDWLASPDPAVLRADQDWLSRPEHHLLTWLDADYPAMLRESPRPPMALFVRGDPGLLWQPQIAIVGSRNPTADGSAHARDFASTLSRSGLAVTSGLAGGIDSQAHAGALAADGITIAVVGTGVDVVYPAGNAALAARIAERGAIVSEFPPGTAARAQHFPQRNRIIAGLSLGTFVVEAALRSGSLITARLAGEAGREVFALPGSVHNPMARGCHRLIRDGARLVETAGEIIQELRPLAQRLGERLRATLALAEVPDADQPPGTMAPGSERLADPDYRRLWDALGYDPAPVDVLVRRSGLTASAISSMLLLMELDGFITVGANGRYGRAVRKAE